MRNYPSRGTEAEALEKGWAFGKGRLRDQYRMKPKPDAKPDSYVKNHYNGSLYGITISSLIA
ncbi:hypothetical protein [Enterovibrio norvegicus]|uniref:hypothetical protein n=1 Tax=Enterovibrio norvegicus TaxID=188144 RepID=UPI0039B0EA26